MTTGDALVAEAQRFATDLTATVRAVVGGHVEDFRARALHRPGRDHVSVHQEPRTGIPLTVEGAPLLNLTVEYYCVWDSPGQFLAVDDLPSRSMPVRRPPASRCSGTSTYARREQAGERREPVEKMFGLPTASEQLAAALRAREWLQKWAGLGGNKGDVAFGAERSMNDTRLSEPFRHAMEAVRQAFATRVAAG